MTVRFMDSMMSEVQLGSGNVAIVPALLYLCLTPATVCKSSYPIIGYISAMFYSGLAKNHLVQMIISDAKDLQTPQR